MSPESPYMFFYICISASLHLCISPAFMFLKAGMVQGELPLLAIRPVVASVVA